ncbi:DUF5333 domain-containing protein [Roseisalinus antarcticus]|uniref:NADH dehydrogenase subunit E n=1 Tax=Roseisalinus antarcticus TaxID=254357 RepID=A0A1Y5SIJ9_9RHOB|nr:DUF5333 domain-containing protein [Roseisalinus antarcticus]SLN41308.1 hypothetical protein ROA7023_01647 [Roseisalinus antarcticus]
MRPLPIFFAALTLCAGKGLANPPLSEVPVVREGLIAVALAYEIGDKCRDLDARLFRGIAFLERLRGEARRLGYSNDEIDAFIDDDAASDRLEAEARARLRAMGAVEGRGETYCAVGRAEIQRGSQVGQLLR